MPVWKKYSRRRYPIITQLREIREAQDIPRKVVGHKLGYHPMTLGRWERGETLPSLQALGDWCEVLGAELCASPKLSALTLHSREQQ